jgi:hypothetical protein
MVAVAVLVVVFAISRGLLWLRQYIQVYRVETSLGASQRIRG